MRINKHKKRVYEWKNMYAFNEWNSAAIVYGPESSVQVIGYDFIKGLKAYRLFNSRAWYLPPHQDRDRIESTRKWQLKNKLNYGRY